MKYFLLVALVVWSVGWASAGEPRWIRIGTLPAPTDGPASAMLSNGDVLVAGGLVAGVPTAAGLVVDGRTGSLRAIPAMAQARANHVVVAPGALALSQIVAAGGGRIVERFDYDAQAQTGRWVTVGQLAVAVDGASATADDSGSVILTGGVDVASTPQGQAVRISPAASAIVPLGPLATPRRRHSTLTYVNDRGQTSVLTCGGEATPPTTTTELLLGSAWDDRTNPPRVWRIDAAAITDASRTARVTGGSDATGTPMATCEWYDAKSGWRPAPRMSVARSAHAIALCAGPSDTANAILVVGGRGATGPTNTVELFVGPSASDPQGQWTSMPATTVAASHRAISMTASNVPVVSGGRTASGATDVVESYQPLRSANVQFPATEVGATADSIVVVVENTWVLPVRILRAAVVGTAEFVVPEAPISVLLGPGSTHRYTVYFRPALEGPREGRLVVDMGLVADTIQLSGRGVQSTLRLLTSAVDMGTILVASSADTCLPLLVNGGTDTARIDSITVPLPFTVVQPVGRATVPPGDTLHVCLRYSPMQRGSNAEAVELSVGNRLFPVAITGRAQRRYASISGPSTCDTINARPGSTITLSAVANNTSDVAVRVTDVHVRSAIPGTVRLANPALVRFTLAPGQSVVVDVAMTVVREQREIVVVTLVDDGDSTAAAELCVVPRSRTPVLDGNGISLGVVCPGDSISRQLVLKNDGSTESFTLDSIVVDGIAGAATTILPLTIAPRSAARIDLGFRVGSQLGTAGVTVYGSFGTLRIDVLASLADAVAVRHGDAAVAPGFEGTQDVRAEAGQGGTLSYHIRYPAGLLLPRALLEAALPLDPTSAITVVEPGLAAVTIIVPGPPAAGTIVGRIVWEGLRGDDTVATVATVSPEGTCVLPDTATIVVSASCAPGGRVRMGASMDVLVAPQPVPMEGNISIVGGPAAWLRIVSMTGTTMTTMAQPPNTTTVDCSTWPAGLYTIVCGRADGAVSTTAFLVAP